jgi:hypothetical protein
MKSGTFRMLESEATPVRFFGRNVELLLVNDIIFGRERQKSFAKARVDCSIRPRLKKRD